MNPFDIRREKFCELIRLMNRLSDSNAREMKKYKKVRNADGSYQYIKKVYAKDNEYI